MLASLGVGAVLFAVAKMVIAAGILFLTISLVFLFTDIFDIVMNFALSKMAGVLDIQAATMEFTGFAAWVAQQLRFQDCLAFIMSAIFAKWLLRKIPFIRW